MTSSIKAPYYKTSRNFKDLAQMANITFKGNPISTITELPAVGRPAPLWTLTTNDLKECSNTDFSGKNIILNIFPSIDTATCAASVRQFNKLASLKDNTQIICISCDLPFAQKRFCGAEGIDKIITASCFRHPEFGMAYGVTITNSAMRGLLSRAIVIIDTMGKIIYTEQVTELTEEPNYNAALAIL